MADSHSTVVSWAASAFSSHERNLIEKTEAAIREGLQLQQWCREQIPNLRLFPLNLKKKFRLPNRAEGFFGSVDIDGAPTSVMGCRQSVDFGRITSKNAPELLSEFVLGEFLKRAKWIYDDGFPGGFTVEQSLYKSSAGEYGRHAEEARASAPDWRRLGSQYEWVLLTVHIHDFVMDFGPIRKRFKEAACVAAHPSFVHVQENPSEKYAYEVSVGYPFVAHAPIPNYFGFGPGKFGAAVKLYTFRLTTKNELHVEMVFAAAPRCQKVFDFGKRWPDPVYGGAKLFGDLTFGLWNPNRLRDRLDAQMLAQHSRVHQALMDGVEKVWSGWLKRSPVDRFADMATGAVVNEAAADQ
jgi:hypothetical protein